MEQFQAIAHVLVLAPLALTQFLARRLLALQECGHGLAGEHLDGPVKAPLAVVQVDGARGNGISSFAEAARQAHRGVASATAVDGGQPGGKVESLFASAAVILQPSHVGDACVLRESRQSAMPASRRSRGCNTCRCHGHRSCAWCRRSGGCHGRWLWLLGPQLGDRAHRLAQPQQGAESIGEKDCVWIQLYCPVEVLVATQTAHSLPDPDEDAGVQRCVPLASSGDIEGALNRHCVHAWTQGDRIAAENVVSVATENAKALGILRLQQGRLVACGQHEAEAIHRRVRSQWLLCAGSVHRLHFLFQARF
mmetsp:Transcript_24505/g.52023  ORF Transcript_24505/g.52023 Transcript_24505/m.52023 type:complete len:308 (+) Transcript_24505:256-1179(+)